MWPTCVAHLAFPWGSAALKDSHADAVGVGE